MTELHEAGIDKTKRAEQQHYYHQEAPAMVAGLT